MKQGKIKKFIFLIFAFSFTFFIGNPAKSADNQEPNLLTGNWNGLRTTLANNGIWFNAIYSGEVISNLSGGVSHASNYRDLAELILLMNSDKIMSWQGSTLYFNVFGTHGNRAHDCVGDIQGVSNIAARNIWRLSEAWIQHKFMDDRVSVLAGFYDINTEFDVLDKASQFVHSSHGMGAGFAQSGTNGPSTFPCTGLAFRLKTRISDLVTFQSAIIDGSPEKKPTFTLSREKGALISSELIFSREGTQYTKHIPKRRYFSRQPRRFGTFSKNVRHWKRGGGRNKKSIRNHIKKKRNVNNQINSQYEKIGVGAWYYTTGIDVVSENWNREFGSWGAYFLFERSFDLKRSDLHGEISYFFRAGISDKKTNRIDRYLGGGIVISELVSIIKNDQIGVAVAAAHNSSTYKQAILEQQSCGLDDWEIAFELSYHVELKDWLSIQPDFQYIINPGFKPNLSDVIIAGLRTEICF